MMTMKRNCPQVLVFTCTKMEIKLPIPSLSSAMTDERIKQIYDEYVASGVEHAVFWDGWHKLLEANGLLEKISTFRLSNMPKVINKLINIANSGESVVIVNSPVASGVYLVFKNDE
jgi:hypothetical protein